MIHKKLLFEVEKNLSKLERKKCQKCFIKKKRKKIMLFKNVLLEKKPNICFKKTKMRVN